jgi:hypothetical protein
MSTPLQLGPQIPANIYNALFRWLPTVQEGCTSGSCSIPISGAVTYTAFAAAGTVTAAVVYTAHKRSTGTTSDENNEEGNGDKNTDVETNIQQDSRKDSSVSEQENSNQENTVAEVSAEGRSPVNSSETEYNPPTVDEDPVSAAVLNAKENAAKSSDVRTAKPDGETPNKSQAAETSKSPIGDEDELLRRSLAPGGIERDFYTARIGKKHRRILFVEELPSPLDCESFLPIFNDPTLQFDMSIHFDPINKGKAKRKSQKRADELSAEANTSKGSSTGARSYAKEKKTKAAVMRSIRESIKEGSQPFNTSIYVSVKGDSEEEVKKQEEEIVTKMKDRPTEMKLSTLRGRQVQGLQSISPIGKDVIRKETDIDTTNIVLGGGVGALLAPMSVSSELNPNGIEIGEHVTNGMPLIRDPFDSETNYNQVIIGDSGAGKSYNVKLQALREAARTDDRMIIMLDPLEGFNGLAAALDAKHIPVGGQRGFNPLEIEKPSEEALEKDANKESALKIKVKSVISFIGDFLEEQDFSGENQATINVILSKALYQAYEEKGITHDPQTHDNPSPTLVDVREIIKELAVDPSPLNPANEEQKQKLKSAAGELHTLLDPFVNGEYQNLGKKSDISIKNEDFIYVDLSPQENSDGGGSGLMMTLLFQILYEKGKATPKEVIFIIDEAQFMFKEGHSLDFLSQRVRHSRHFDMSIRFATQNVKDFMRTDKASDIIHNAYLTIYHRTHEIKEFTDDLNITEAHANFIEGARAGKKYDHSHALFNINQEYYPVKISANDAEHAIVSHGSDDDRDELPGIDRSQSPLGAEIENRLEQLSQFSSEEASAMEPAIDGNRLKNSDLSLSEKQQKAIDLIGWEYLIQALEEIDEGKDPDKVLSKYIDLKVAQMIETLGKETLRERLFEDEANPTNELSQIDQEDTEDNSEQNIENPLQGND